jgi:hypothetical protein
MGRVVGPPHLHPAELTRSIVTEEPNDQQETPKQDAPKKRRSRLKIGLIIFLLLLIGGLFKIGLIKIPECHPDIQKEVDWPPEETGYYEEGSHNKLRSLEEAGYNPVPGTVSLCNVEGAPAADVVAFVPAEPVLYLYLPELTDFEYHLYQGVDLTAGSECVRAARANEVELTVEPDADNPQVVRLRPGSPLTDGENYMLIVGGEMRRGLVLTVGTAE